MGNGIQCESPCITCRWIAELVRSDTVHYLMDNGREDNYDNYEKSCGEIHTRLRYHIRLYERVVQLRIGHLGRRSLLAFDRALLVPLDVLLFILANVLHHIVTKLNFLSQRVAKFEVKVSNF